MQGNLHVLRHSGRCASLHHAALDRCGSACSGHEPHAGHDARANLILIKDESEVKDMVSWLMQQWLSLSSRWSRTPKLIQSSRRTELRCDQPSSFKTRFVKLPRRLLELPELGCTSLACGGAQLTEHRLACSAQRGAFQRVGEP